MSIRPHITDPEAFRVALPQLAAGEHYVGALGDQLGNLHHIILLPGDMDGADWQTQMEWAQRMGGDLPSKTELAMLWDSSRDQFQRDWYWSNQEYELDSRAAWCQAFSAAGQISSLKGAELRARAVRRVPVQCVGEQRAPAAGDALHDPALQKLFGEAVTGALGFGAQGVNPPPEGHWLEPFWQTARADAIAAGDEHAARDAAFEAVSKRLCALPRYSFLIGPNGEGVQRVKDRSGNWIEFDAAHALFDPVVVDAATAAQQGEGGAA